MCCCSCRVCGGVTNLLRGGIIGADPPGKAGEPASRRPEVGLNSAKGDAVKMNEIVSLKDIVVDFDGERILDELSLDIHDKEFGELVPFG